ncbi:CDP-alcohol phosphatidyltransferase family protein [Gulosibacter molinativorax]|uniref:CDP-alcohol phosphatidyltransferase family protein n=1 Tax=Gulosibacter molinativorax TaxID=256821 RepID=A0ABT7C5U6_9MICO|nr:CDP-alcohol phosphatidyltransferase family protein [Gulosibacter molinativorax]MDJ1370539.1 CDP-alcohol phosphatidyltransferase family protein [Gulosibacter molinativorax]QUY62048.1 CDP-diacylglycerol-glycerol-3-phosphate 3-phosphatidyltransferase protein [Gulosibacter molinativorax]
MAGEYVDEGDAGTSGAGREAAAHGLERRNIPQRSTGWAKRAADLLYAARLTPNSISVLSVVIAFIGAVALGLSGFVPALDIPRWVLLVIAAVCIPLRLLCNMFDGMLAVEKRMHSPTGDLFNELPDRIADVALLVGAGFATIGLWRSDGAAWGTGVDWGLALGWLAAVLAILTAYVRTLGAANGVGNFFGGPMAKPPRMWLLVIGSLLSIAEPGLGLPRGIVLAITLGVIALGSLMTVIVRLRKITLALRAASQADAADAADAAGRP